MNKNKFSKQYLIELECIDEANNFGLELGEIVYAAGWDGTDFAHDINNASLASDIKYAKEVARRIYAEGDFTPTIKEVVRTVGKSIKF